MDNREMATMLRKLASDIRQEAREIEEKKAVKCAQTLIAANGLSRLAKMIKGAVR